MHRSRTRSGIAARRSSELVRPPASPLSLLARKLTHLHSSVFFLFGPAALMEGARDILHSLDVPTTRILQESVEHNRVHLLRPLRQTRQQRWCLRVHEEVALRPKAEP